MRRHVLSLLCLLGALLCGAAMLAHAAPAETTIAAESQGFDHLTTGFALTGVHSHTRCESCHERGVMRGTPRDCAGCHGANGRVARARIPMNHMPTTAS